MCVCVNRCTHNWMIDKCRNILGFSMSQDHPAVIRPSIVILRPTQPSSCVPTLRSQLPDWREYSRAFRKVVSSRAERASNAGISYMSYISLIRPVSESHETGAWAGPNHIDVKSMLGLNTASWKNTVPGGWGVGGRGKGCSGASMMCQYCVVIIVILTGNRT